MTVLQAEVWVRATRRRIPAAGSSPAFHGHGEPHEHHGHDEPARRWRLHMPIRRMAWPANIKVSPSIHTTSQSSPTQAYNQAINDLDKELEYLKQAFEGRTLRCSLSQAKHRLFIGNVPKGLSEKELTNIIKGKGPGVVNTEMFKDQHGFLFVEYYNQPAQNMPGRSFHHEASRLMGAN